MTNLLRTAFPVGSPVWLAYRACRLGFKPLAPGHVLHGNILLAEPKVIYFYVPKVACSTFKKIAADYLRVGQGGRDVAETIHTIEFPFARKYKVRTQFADYYKFAFVRNPWDRLLSCYRDKLCDAADHVYERHENRFITYLQGIGAYKPGMSFEEFVDIAVEIPDHGADGHLRSQVSILSDRHGLLPLDALGKFEQLTEDFAPVAARLGISGSLPHLRSTGKRGDYRDHYSARTRELVRTRYEQDIRAFGYEF